jgi:hypothetical protein
MVGLVDIAAATETVSIRGKDVDVVGVSVAGVAMLLARFPDLRRLFGGAGDVGVQELAGMGGDLVAAIIAAGTGRPGDEATEKAAAQLTIDEQLDLIVVILRVTLPKGVGPFMEKLLALGGNLDAGGLSATGPVTTLRKRSSG